MPILVWPIIRAFENAILNPQAVSWDGVADLKITGPSGLAFIIFMDCGRPDYLDHVETPDGVADFSEQQGEHSALGYIMTNNMVWHYEKEIQALAQQQPNFDEVSP